MSHTTNFINISDVQRNLDLYNLSTSDLEKRLTQETTHIMEHRDNLSFDEIVTYNDNNKKYFKILLDRKVQEIMPTYWSYLDQISDLQQKHLMFDAIYKIKNGMMENEDIGRYSRYIPKISDSNDKEEALEKLEQTFINSTRQYPKAWKRIKEQQSMHTSDPDRLTFPIIPFTGFLENEFPREKTNEHENINKRLNEDVLPLYRKNYTEGLYSLHGQVHGARIAFFTNLLRKLCQSEGLEIQAPSGDLEFIAAMRDSHRKNDGYFHPSEENCNICAKILIEKEGRKEADVRFLMQSMSEPNFDPKDSTDLAVLYDANLISESNCHHYQGIFKYSDLRLFGKFKNPEIVYQFVEEARLFINITEHCSVKVFLQRKKEPYQDLFEVLHIEKEQFPLLHTLASAAIEELILPNMPEREALESARESGAHLQKSVIVNKDQQQELELIKQIRKSRYDNPWLELNRLKGAGVIDELTELKLKTSAPIPLLQAMIGKAIEIRQFYGENYDVAIHGQSWSWLIVPDLIKELMKKKHPEKAFHQFKFLRLPPGGPVAPIERYSTAPNVNDHRERGNLISADLNFYNNDSQESAQSFLLSSSNISGKPLVLEEMEKIIKYFYPSIDNSLSSHYADLLLDVDTDRERVPISNLFVICMPKENASKLYYFAHPGGTACNCHPSLDLRNRVALLEQGTERIKCNQYFPQIRIYTPELMNENRAKIFLLTPDHERRKKIKAEVKKITDSLHTVASLKKID